MKAKELLQRLQTHSSDTPAAVGKEVLSTSVSVQVENKPQLLRLLRPYMAACASIPGDLPENGRWVLKGLFDCFAKAGTVKEGLANDCIWGFQQSGWEPERVVYGLADLHKYGYITFQTQDNVDADLSHPGLGQCWIRYAPKLLDLVYS